MPRPRHPRVRRSENADARRFRPAARCSRSRQAKASFARGPGVAAVAGRSRHPVPLRRRRSDYRGRARAATGNCAERVLAARAVYLLSVNRRSASRSGGFKTPCHLGGGFNRPSFVSLLAVVGAEGFFFGPKNPPPHTPLT